MSTPPAPVVPVSHVSDTPTVLDVATAPMPSTPSSPSKPAPSTPPASMPVAECHPSVVLKKVCEESIMRPGQKRKINLVARDTWMPEFLDFPELDGDSYSKNGHPPKKLMLKKSTNEMKVCGWQQTPCRDGEHCRKWKRGHCFFIHSSSNDDVEVAAGSALRCKRIKRAFEDRIVANKQEKML